MRLRLSSMAHDWRTKAITWFYRWSVLVTLAVVVALLAFEIGTILYLVLTNC